MGAQNIQCTLEDERGNLIKDPGLNFTSITAAIWKLDKDKKKYKWLHTIDEYGLTIFNSLQTPFLLSELEQLKSEVDDDLLKLVSQFIDFISKTDSLQFVKFYGD